MGLSFTNRLPRERTCAFLARRAVEQNFADRLAPEALEDAKLVVTELVDNAYLHGRGEIGLVLAQREDRVRIEVVDEGHGAAVTIRERGAGELGGHGLKLVERLCLGWGAFEGTTHVWAELSAN